MEHYTLEVIYKIYVPRQKGGRGLTNVEMCVRLDEKSLIFYVKNATEEFFIPVRRIEMLINKENKEKNAFKRKKTA